MQIDPNPPSTAGDPLSLAGTYSVATLADLRALVSRPPTVSVAGYAEPGDGGGGVFFWDAASTAVVDNGLVVAPAVGAAGRYRRIADTEVILEWFGAKGDDETDDSDPFTRALATGRKVNGTLGKFYRIKDVVLSGQYLDMQWGRLRPAAGARWGVRLTGWGSRLENYEMEDGQNVVVRSSVLTGDVDAGDVTFGVSALAIAQLEVGMVATVFMDNGRWHISPITGISGTTVTVARAFEADATTGAEVDCSWGMLNVRGATRLDLGEGRFYNTSFGAVFDADPAAGLPFINNRMRVGRHSFEDVRHVGFFSGRNCADSEFADIVCRGGFVETTNHIGDGSTAAFDFDHAGWLKSDITVTVAGIVQTLGVHYNFTSTTQIQFTGGHIPSVGQAIAIANFRDGKSGVCIDATGWSGIRGGDVYSVIEAIDFLRGHEIHTKELTDADQYILDTCSGEGLHVDNCIGAGPITIVDLFAGYCFQPINVVGSSVLLSQEGPLWTTRPAAGDTIAGAVGASAIAIASGSTAYFNAGGWHPVADKVTSGAGTLVFSNSEKLPFAAEAAVAAPATALFGAGGQDSGGGPSFVIDRARRVKRLYILSGSTPGSGKTYAVTLMIDGVASTIFTGSITNGLFVLDLNGDDFVAAHASLQVRVVLLSGAQTSTFRGYIELV